ncbi:uncharacterized protein JCM15063_003154 [Sporobolomyces koalae]|uniref:uncharacterized protein n=1 Tax=Sporobolomyces koalae TaxID=500713 RepID=UPI00317B25A2
MSVCSAASCALSTPAIASRIIMFLCSPESSFGLVAPNTCDAILTRFYHLLLSASLVSQTFRTEAQRVMQAYLGFTRGTRQLAAWLESAKARRSKEQVRNRGVAFYAVSDRAVEWDLDIVKQVLEQIHECLSLHLRLDDHDVLPGLRELTLSCRLESSLERPSFSRLVKLKIVDHDFTSGHDWTSTLSFVLTEQRSSLCILDLAQFPRFATYLIPSFFIVAANLLYLDLPGLDPVGGGQTGSILGFAQACTSLESLRLARVTVKSIPNMCLLLVFAETLQALRLDFVEGSLCGYYDTTTQGQATDTFHHLIDTLEKVVRSHANFKEVDIGIAQWALPDHLRRLLNFSRAHDIRVSIEGHIVVRNPEQRQLFESTIAASLRVAQQEVETALTQKGGKA